MKKELFQFSFLRHRSILGLFPREHFSFKDLSLEQIGVYRSLLEFLTQLGVFSPQESGSDVSHDHYIAMSFSLRFLSLDL